MTVASGAPHSVCTYVQQRACEGMCVCIAVGAVDRNGDLANFTNWAGNATDFEGDGAELPLYVTASGVGIWSTLPGDSIGSLQGTSMATPYVAAAVAILMQADPTLTLNQIRVLLANTTK